MALSPAGTFLPTRTTVRSALLAGAHQRPDHNHCTCPRPFAGGGGGGVWQHAGPEDGKGEYASRTKVPFQMCQWDWPRNDFAKGQSLHASPSSHDLLQVPHRCRQKWLSRRKDTSWEGREGRWDRDGCIFQPRATSK